MLTDGLTNGMTDEQRRSLDEDGYLKLPGLMPIASVSSPMEVAS